METDCGDGEPLLWPPTPPLPIEPFTLTYKQQCWIVEQETIMFGHSPLSKAEMRAIDDPLLFLKEYGRLRKPPPPRAVKLRRARSVPSPSQSTAVRQQPEVSSSPPPVRSDGMAKPRASPPISPPTPLLNVPTPADAGAGHLATCKEHRLQAGWRGQVTCKRSRRGGCLSKGGADGSQKTMNRPVSSSPSAPSPSTSLSPAPTPLDKLMHDKFGHTSHTFVGAFLRLLPDLGPFSLDIFTVNSYLMTLLTDPAVLEWASHSPNPALRPHTRSLNRAPSFTLSDPVTFHTAPRTLATSIPRSVRFRNLSMSSPPPIPPRPSSSAATNPNEELAEQAEARRRAAFEENEARIKQELEEQLEMADEECLAQGPRQEGGVVAPPPGVDGETVVLERQLQELRDREATLERILLARRTPGTHLPIQPTPSSYEQLVVPSSDVVDIAFKKVSAPKAWTGEFNHRRREAWIKTALGYLSSIGIPPFLKLDWFDGVQRRSPFPTVHSIFDSMRSHWVEEGAADLAFSKYRKAAQGSLKVWDFGALVDVLANDIFDRQVTDEDKKATFLEGLNTSARNFVKQVQATQVASSGTERVLDFEGLVRLASRYDTMDARTTSTSSSLPVVLSNRRSSAPSTADPSAPKSSGKLPSSAGLPKSWVDLATTWQARYPIKDKSSWYEKDSKELSDPVRCYNCTRTGYHYSLACPNARQDPQVVVIAALARLSPLPPSSPPPSDLAAESEVEVSSSPLAGKGNGV
ncbi:hypothetical protein JCM11641_006617 [Rhodosporidiobolus odoratus]